MIKTLKTTKKLRLDELINYIFEEDIKPSKNLIKYRSKFGTVVEVDMSGQIAIYGRHFGNELYTVEIEEEITKDTVFDYLLAVENDGTVYHEYKKSIDGILNNYSNIVQILAKIDGKYRTIGERED